MSERTTPHVDLSALIAESGLTEAALLEQLTAQSRRPTVADHVESYLKVQTAGTRRGYATHLNRFVSGYGAVCDQTCEPCLVDDGNEPFTCRCACRACATSQIRIEPRSSDVVGTSVYTTEVVQQLAAVANATHAVKKPRRNTGERRPMQEFELLELCHLTSTSGNDTLLDELIVDFGIATGSRREGVYLLTVGQLHRDTQTVDEPSFRQPVTTLADVAAMGRQRTVGLPSSPPHHGRLPGDPFRTAIQKTVPTAR